MCKLCNTDYTQIEEELQEDGEMVINCRSIDTVPAFHNLVELKLHACFDLQYIPTIRSLQYLEINACPSLLRLPVFPYLCNIRVSSSRIRQIPSMPRLLSIQLYACPMLFRIHSQRKLAYLKCISTTRLIFFPEDNYPNLVDLELTNLPIYDMPRNMPNLHHLTLENMRLLTRIPTYTMLNSLVLKECHQITTIPVIPALRQLTITNWNNVLYKFHIPERAASLEMLALHDVRIDKIPYLPCLLFFDIQDCKELQLEHKYPDIDMLTIINCPLVNELPVVDIHTLVAIDCHQQPGLEIYNRFFPGIGDSRNMEYEDNRKKLSFLQDKFRRHFENRRMLKLLRISKSLEFAEYFWHPDNYGGRWCINRLNRRVNSIQDSQTDSLIQSLS